MAGGQELSHTINSAFVMTLETGAKAMQGTAAGYQTGNISVVCTLGIN